MRPKIHCWKKLNPTAPYVVDYRVDGKRRRKYFATRDEAKAERDRILVVMRKEGEDGLKVPNAIRLQAMEAQQLLAPFPGKTIVDAARFYAAHLESLQRSVSVRQLVDEYIREVEGLGRSEVHLGDLRGRYDAFCVDFGNRQTRTLTSAEVKTWINGRGLSPVSFNNFRSRLSSLFRFGIREGYLDINPCDKIKEVKVVDEPPAILPVNSLAALLDAADVEILPMVAISAFAGVRTAELLRLTWAEVNLDSGLIEIKKSKSKTASRRLIPIQPNLRAWLAPYAGMTGPLWSGDVNSFMRARAKLVTSAGVDWPKNSARHSFCSYHVALFQDEKKLRNDMGHTDSTLIFSTYRELVSPAEGDRYFNLYPPTPAANVISQSVSLPA
jgi:integrase